MVEQKSTSTPTKDLKVFQNIYLETHQKISERDLSFNNGFSIILYLIMWDTWVKMEVEIMILLPSSCFYHTKMLLCITTTFGNKVDSMPYPIVWWTSVRKIHHLNLLPLLFCCSLFVHIECQCSCSCQTSK